MKLFSRTLAFYLNRRSLKISISIPDRHLSAKNSHISKSNPKNPKKVNLRYVFFLSHNIKFCVNWHYNELLCMASTRNINYYWFTKKWFWFVCSHWISFDLFTFHFQPLFKKYLILCVPEEIRKNVETLLFFYI